MVGSQDQVGGRQGSQLAPPPTVVGHARTSSPSHRPHSLVSRSPDPEDTRGEDRGRSLPSRPSQEKPVSKDAGRVRIVIDSLKETPWMMGAPSGGGELHLKSSSGEQQFSWGRGGQARWEGGWVVRKMGTYGQGYGRYPR